MKKFLVLALVMASALVPAIIAYAVTPSESNGHWPGTGERTITVYDLSRTAVWDTAVRAAAAEWSKSPYINLVVVDGPPPAPGTCPMAGAMAINYCVENIVCNCMGWSMEELPAPTDGHYTGAFSMIVNDYGDDAWSAYGRQWISCHELGHALGITRHLSQKGKTRVGCVGGSLAVPDPADYALLASIYSHSP